MAKAQKLIIIAIVVFCVLSLIFVKETNQAYAYDLLDNLQPNSAENPYLITSAQDINDLSNAVNGGNSMEGHFFKLINNITLLPDFIPIGNMSNQFKGNFDGDNFSITISLNRSDIYNGIFGVIGASGVVKNLRTSGDIIGGNTTGGIAGYNLGTISNCINSVSVQAQTSSVESVGGITGINYGNIKNCINLGTICGNYYAGGIAGKNMSAGNSAGTVNGIINLGNLTYIVGANSYVIGGLIGQNDGIVKNGYNYCSITNSGSHIGSIIGFFGATARLGDCKNCYNNNAKSAISVVGTNAQNRLPDNYISYSIYDFLGSTSLVFESGIMTIPEFDTGYGYFPFLTDFYLESSLVNLVRHCLFESGSGSEENPFIINNASQWQLFSKNTLIHDYDNTYVKLNCNITQIAPLSNFDYPFNGIFDGNNKTITLNISDIEFGGMFRYVGINGIIKNLNMTGWVTVSGNYAGSVAAYLSGCIKNVNSSARIISSAYAGGIAGEIYNTALIDNLENVKNTGAVEGNGYLGGIVGYAYNLHTTGQIINAGIVQGSNINAGSFFGGIAGQIDNNSKMIYSNWLNSNLVSAVKGEYVGGLVGKITNADIICSMNISSITGKSYVGGITGSIAGGAFNSVGVVCSITGADYTAGMAGAILSDSSITDSYFSGKFHKLPKAAIVNENFHTLANSSFALEINKVYYNGDFIDAEGISDTSLIIPAIQGESASYIQLTDINGLAHTKNFSSNEYWIIEEKSLNFGFYPFPKGFDTNTINIIKNIVKYNYFNSGNGTLDSPFIISKAQELYNFSYLHNNYLGYSALYYRQNSDLSLDSDFTPIGNNLISFSGNYNGNYFKIKNLTINNSITNYNGFFGMISNAVIEKICIVSGTINGTGYIGSIAGYAQNSNISNCYSLININSTGDTTVGGILGFLESSNILGCFNTGRINANNQNAGGIAGYCDSSSSINKCFNTGMITGFNAVSGGIIGKNNGGNIFACYNSGTIKVTSEVFVGGIAGISSGTIQNCYTIAKVIYITAVKSGSIAGEVNTGVNNYLNSCFYNIDICSLYPHSATTTTTYNAKTTAQMETAEGENSFLNSFTDNTLYKFGLSNTQDSHFAPRLSIFTSTGNADIDKYSALSVRLRLFGWNDESESEWGSQNNPYIITNRNQLTILSNLVGENYKYTNYYFRMDNDIDMRIDGNKANFNPIGSYVDAQNNHMFNGNFDGGGYKLIYLYINSIANNVGLFSYLGNNASLKNLIIDSNSSIITTGNYVGSFVGRNLAENGIIDRCVSYASVSGFSNVGGLIGFTYHNTKITNCLFDGNLSGNSHVYGSIGILTNSSSNVITTNTWYIFRYDEATNKHPYIVRGDEGYLNNGYCATLFVDKNGAVEVTVDPSKNNSEFIVFTLLPNVNFKGCYMDGNDNIINPQPIFYSIENTTLTSLYARFTLPVNTVITGGDAIINISGEGDYYCGQNVVLKISFIQYGYFINIFDFMEGIIKTEYAGFIFSNDGEQVWISFNLPNDAVNEEIINIELLSTNDYISLTASNNEYSGNDNNATVIVNGAGTGYFDNISLRYYYGISKTGTLNTINAGIYEVRARLVVDSAHSLPSGLFLGIQTLDFTVSKKMLDASIDWNWEGLLGKEYDGVNYKNNVNVTDNISGIIPIDIPKVTVYSTLTWSDADAGSNLDVNASNFILNGELSKNYDINNLLTVTNIGGGFISAKNITVKINESGLTYIYNDNKPSITDVTVSGSLGEVNLDYMLVPVDNENIPIPDWSGIWNTGRYSVSVSTNNTNYIVNLYEVYYINIIPIVIYTITYSGYNNLTYTGSNLNGTIKGIYSTLYAGEDNVNLTYYHELNPEEALLNVINAGNYTAIPSINIEGSNYVLASNVNVLNFSIKKAIRSEQLGISLKDGITEAAVGDDDINIVLTNKNFDGILTLNKIGNADRGKLLLIKNGEEYYIRMVSYGNITFNITESNCLNYNDRTSNTLTITINPKAVYIGIKNSEWYYGDDIFDNITEKLELKYSWDIEQNTLLTSEETDFIISQMSSYAECRLTSSILKANNEYEVKIMGAQSEGYRFYTSNANKITIQKRPIEIIVAVETNIKVYGDADADIKYSIKDLVKNIIVNTLPNGESISIMGKLERESGENAGAYTINKGTINSANNPNYEISFSIGGSYIIARKTIKFVMPNYSKYYLEKDPIFAPIPASGYNFVGKDNINSVNISITRNPGESIGVYNYILGEYNGGINYNVSSVEINTKFTILKAIPVINILSIGTVTWGDNLSTALIFGSAMHLGLKIEGTFRWLSGTTIVTNAYKSGDRMFYDANAEFSPFDDNIDKTIITVAVNVLKRKLAVNYTGNFDYDYTGNEIVKNYSLSLSNVVDGTKPKITGIIDKTPIDSGEYIITPILIDDCDGVYELNENTETKTIRIYPRIITVTIDGGEIMVGDTYIPTITYSGFVGNDDENSLTQKATAGAIPTEMGYYSITPSGAVAKNYIFVYISSALVIRKNEAKSENVILRGNLAPEISVSVKNVASNVPEYNDVNISIDNVAGATVIKPNKNEMVEYLKFDITGNLNNNTKYEVKFSNNIEKGMLLYIVNSDGSIYELTDFTVNEEGLVEFYAGNIKGIGVFKAKSILRYAKDFLLLGGIALGIIAIIILTIFIVSFKRKVERIRREISLK